jgi:hypothetical protein
VSYQRVGQGVRNGTAAGQDVGREHQAAHQAPAK